MIKLKTGTFLMILASVVLATALMIGCGFLIFSKAQNVRLIKADSYRQMAELNERYSKLYLMQNRINTEGLKKVSESKEMDAIYKGLVDSLDDPYSEYFTAKEAQEFDNHVNNSFYGIGVIFHEEDNGDFLITQVQKDGPADLAGLRKGDIILEVDGKASKSGDELKEAVAGESGTKVKITYSREGEENTVSITRGIVNDATCSGFMLKGHIAYIRIDTFGEGTAKEFEKALDELRQEKPKGLILDLRNNVGGMVDQGIEVADTLLPECTIAYVEDRNGTQTIYNSDEGSVDLPCAVLVNQYTASTSELVAAAVKENDAGKLVGTTTFGKGVVQTEYKYKDGSALKLTTAQYLSPKGHKIDGKGVTPDYKVKLPEDATEDDQLKKAMSLVDDTGK